MTWDDDGWREAARDYQKNQKPNGGVLESKRRSQADVLLELALDAELFLAPDGTGYADIIVNGHRETWPIKSRGCRRWLARRYFETEHKAVRSEPMNSVLGVLEAKAQFDAPKHEVHMRIAEHGGCIYIDLSDKEWRAVKISADGWTIVERPPVRFRRAKGMLSLPVPLSGGSIDALRKYLNVKNDSEFVLAVSCLLAALRGRGPYPVLALSGEHGAAKSTFSRLLRSLFDPNSAPLRTLPRSERDLAISANNSYAQVFENISSLSDWLSDALARLATGGGLATRELYTDDEEVLFEATRPIILNGIEDFVARPDLGDRTVLLTLENIPDDRRKLEKDIWSEFEHERPRIFGALLDAVAHGLRQLPHVHLGRLPRMADFAHWATACETALWPAGTFMAAYRENIARMVDITLEASSVAEAIREFMVTRTEWEGTSKDLLAALAESVGEQVVQSKGWPSTPRNLSGRLRRDAAGLRRIGVEVVFGGEGRKRRAIRMTKRVENDLKPPSPPSPPSPAHNINDLAGTVADSQSAPTVTPIVTPNPLKTNDGDCRDGGDGCLHAFPDHNSNEYASLDRLCDHCGRPSTAKDPLRPWDWPGRPDGIRLHSCCEELWFDSGAPAGGTS
jgi:hypothetical protein